MSIDTEIGKRVSAIACLLREVGNISGVPIEDAAECAVIIAKSDRKVAK